MTEDAPQREQSLREVFNGKRPDRADRSTIADLAVDTLGHMLALHITLADELDRAQVGELAATVQEVTDHHIQLADLGSRLHWR
jgi:hypothetical protein